MQYLDFGDNISLLGMLKYIGALNTKKEKRKEMKKDNPYKHTKAMASPLA